MSEVLGSSGVMGAVTELTDSTTVSLGPITSSSSDRKSSHVDETQDDSSQAGAAIPENGTKAPIIAPNVAVTSDCADPPERSMTNPSPPAGRPPSYTSPRFTLPLHSNIPLLPTSSTGKDIGKNVTSRSQRDDDASRSSDGVGSVGSKNNRRPSNSSKGSGNIKVKRNSIRDNNENGSSNNTSVSSSSNNGGSSSSSSSSWKREDEID